MICIHQSRKEIHRFDATPLYTCDKCGLIFTDKHRQEFNVKSLYKRYYQNEMSGKFGFGIEHIIRLFRFFRAFKVFTLYPNAKSILDVGSGRGFMLYYLKKYYKFKRAVGTQISENAFEFSRRTLCLEVYDKDLLELSFEKGSFDIITIWHVLEHVAKPEEYIAKIFDILDDHGRLIIEVPNFNSWSRGLTGKYWLGLDLDYHINFFTPKSLCSLLEKYRFKIKTTHTFSLEYSTFISTQSLVSLLTRSEHIFFKLLQEGGFSWRLILHGSLFILFAPFCFLINVSIYFSKRGEVLLIVAEKNI